MSIESLKKVLKSDPPVDRRDQLQNYFNTKLVPYYQSQGYDGMSSVDQSISYLRQNHPQAYNDLIKDTRTFDSPTDKLPPNPLQIGNSVLAEGALALQGKDADITRALSGDQITLSNALGVDNKIGAFILDSLDPSMLAGLASLPAKQLAKKAPKVFDNAFSDNVRLELSNKARKEFGHLSDDEMDEVINQVKSRLIDDLSSNEGRKRLQKVIDKRQTNRDHPEVNSSLFYEMGLEDPYKFLKAQKDPQFYVDKVKNTDITKSKDVTQNFAYPSNNKITISNIGNKKSVENILEHEFAHIIQRDIPGPTTDILNNLKMKSGYNMNFKNNYLRKGVNRTPEKDLIYDVYTRRFKDNEYPSDQLFESVNHNKRYFLEGSNPTSVLGSLEKEAFLTEFRNQLLQDKVIKGRYDNVTPEQLFDYHSKYKAGQTGGKSNRILDIIDDAKPENYKILSDALKVLPTAGAGVMLNETNKKMNTEPQNYALGGVLTGISAGMSIINQGSDILAGLRQAVSPSSYTPMKQNQNPRGLELGGPYGDKKVLQTHLKDLGYYKGEVDGILGKQSGAAVRAFQKDHDLSVDGIVGKNTSSALQQAYSSYNPLTKVSTPIGASDDKLYKGYTFDPVTVTPQQNPPTQESQQVDSDQQLRDHLVSQRRSLQDIPRFPQTFSQSEEYIPNVNRSFLNVDNKGYIQDCEEEHCAEFVTNLAIDRIDRGANPQNFLESTGITGNAWNMGDNILDKGGTEVYFREKTGDHKNDPQTGYWAHSEMVESNAVRPGDIVMIKTYGSSYTPEAKEDGDGFTHAGMVTNVNEDGT